MKKYMKSLSKDKKLEANDYFQQATSWVDDYYTSVVASRNRYRIAFLGAMALTLALSVSVSVLVPNERFIPIKVTRYADNDVVVEPFTQPHPPMNQAQTESDVVRYVINRESYSADGYDVQYRLVKLLSSSEVAQDYQEVQRMGNPDSPINTLGRSAIRQVHVESILFLDNESMQHQATEKAPHVNLAQVNFTVSVREKDRITATTTPFTALVSWRYRGISKDKDMLWQNWNGFEVTRYDVQQRSLTTHQGDN
jgi:type IV secretion system protein VirB8